MSPQPSKPWFVTDPIHKTLNLTRQLRSVVETPEFQRLRRVSQLGLASYVFPGAVHTRFSHCLGAAHLATRILDHLRKQDRARDVKDRMAIQYAALLHDIGHGPFSHSFERAMKSAFGKDRVPKHEDWSRKIITERLTILSEEVRNEIASIIAPKKDATGVPSLGRAIVASQIDVDRMDYLVRDAHFTGVPTGAIDLDYLIRSIRIVRHGSSEALGITAKGLTSYEAFLFGRHCMTRSVYRHPMVATFECMMERCLALLANGKETKTLPSLPGFFRRVQQDPPKDKGQLMNDLLSDYLLLTEDRIWSVLLEAGQSKGKLGDLSRQLLKREPRPSYAIASGREKILEAELVTAGLSDSCAIVDLSSVLYKSSGDSRVFVTNSGKGELPQDIREASSLVQSYRDRDEPAFIAVVFDKEKDVLNVGKESRCFDPRGLREKRPPLAKTGARAVHPSMRTRPANDVMLKARPSRKAR